LVVKELDIFAFAREEVPLVTIVTTRNALPRSKILEAMAPRFKEKQSGGQTYFFVRQPPSPNLRRLDWQDNTERGTALYFVNDHTLVFGYEKAVRQILDRGAQPEARGPLSPALQQAAGGHGFVVGVNNPQLILRTYIPVMRHQTPEW